MTTTADPPETRAAATWSGWPRWIGIGLLLGWVLLIVAVVLVGERKSSLDSLEDAIASDDVDVVHTAGGLGPSGIGYATLELRWRDGLFNYVAEVRETRGRHRAPQGTRDDDAAPFVRAGVVERLEKTYPDLRVEADGDETQPLTGEMFGWRLPGWLTGCGFGLSVALLLLIIAGPQPWRATRWAWFWLTFIAPPLGAFGYLALGGPAGITRQPPPDAGRLTGGWAFLLMLVVGSLVATVVANLT